MNFKKWLPTIGQWVLTFGISFFVVSWLVDGSFWLHFFIAAALSKGSDAAIWTMRYQKLETDLQRLSLMFNIADVQLVKVSAQVDSMEEENYSLTSKLQTIEDELSAINYRIRDFHFATRPAS